MRRLVWLAAGAALGALGARRLGQASGVIARRSLGRRVRRLRGDLLAAIEAGRSFMREDAEQRDCDERSWRRRRT
jgi:hypothetical protein